MTKLYVHTPATGSTYQIYGRPGNPSVEELAELFPGSIYFEVAA